MLGIPLWNEAWQKFFSAEKTFPHTSASSRLRSCRPPHCSGVTFIELVIAIGIMAIITAAGMTVSFETYQGNNFRNDRDLLVALLQRARAQAINNTCNGACGDGAAHGVHVQSDAYVVFQGPLYDSADIENVRYDAAVSVTRTTGDIVFQQLTGNSSAGTIILTDAHGRASDISVNDYGRITWTN